MSLPPAAPTSVSTKTTLASWFALGLSILGAILAFVPLASFGAWVFTLAGFVLAIIGLVQRGRNVVPAIALPVSIIAFIAAVVVSVGTIFANIPGSPVEPEAPVADGRVAVVFEAQGGGKTAPQEMAGDYAVSWETFGTCYYSAELDDEFSFDILTVHGVTSGTNYLYDIPAGSHFVEMMTGPACGWRAEFAPQ